MSTADRKGQTIIVPRPIRVLHIIPSVAPRYGGPSTAIVAITMALNRLEGVTAEVLATDADGDGSFQKSSWGGQNTPLYLMPRRDRLAFNRFLSEHAAKFNLFHTHSVWNAPVYDACQFARREQIPLIYRPCGMLSSYSWSRRKLLRYGYWLLRERRNVLSASAFHCTSEAEAAEVRSHRAARGPIYVIPNGVDGEAWTTPIDRSELRRRCGPRAGNKSIILFLSRLHPKKGLTDLLLPAFANLEADAFLAIVGGSDDHAPGYEADVRRVIEKLGLTDRVALLGSISPAERWAMFDGASVFVLPSHSENFGIVVAEAMARAIPVVVTAGVQASEHVHKAEAGHVVSPSVSALTSSLDQLLRSPDECRRLGEHGRSYAREHFDWNRIAERIRDMYVEVLEKRTALRTHKEMT